MQNNHSSVSIKNPKSDKSEPTKEKKCDKLKIRDIRSFKFPSFNIFFSSFIIFTNVKFLSSK